MRHFELCCRPLLAFAIAVVCALPAGAQQYSVSASALELQPRRAVPPLPAFPVQLVVDDDQAESAFGINAATSLQFLWFNQFADPGPFTLEEIWVLFPPGNNMVAGAAAQLVVFRDPDGDPATGAELLASFDVTVQAVDGDTFSVYPVSLDILDPGDLLVGVVNRFTDPASTPPITEPAALDTSAGQGASWCLRLDPVVAPG